VRLNALHFVGILSILHSSQQHRNTYFLRARALSQKGGSGPFKVRAASAHNDSQLARSAHLISLIRFSVQSDIYAFGMFLYEVMTHHFPFEKFRTESFDGSALSVSKQHWSLDVVHNGGYENIVKRYSSNITSSLCIPREIELESPPGYVDLLKNCIAVRVLSCP